MPGTGGVLRPPGTTQGPFPPAAESGREKAEGRLREEKKPHPFREPSMPAVGRGTVTRPPLAPLSTVLVGWCRWPSLGPIFGPHLRWSMVPHSQATRGPAENCCFFLRPFEPLPRAGRAASARRTAAPPPPPPPRLAAPACVLEPEQLKQN